MARLDDCQDQCLAEERIESRILALEEKRSQLSLGPPTPGNPVDLPDASDQEFVKRVRNDVCLWLEGSTPTLRMEITSPLRRLLAQSVRWTWGRMVGTYGRILGTHRGEFLGRMGKLLGR